MSNTEPNEPQYRRIPAVLDNIMPFPLFACVWTSSNKAIVCGGGGTKGTGVKSGIVSFAPVFIY